MSESGFDEKKFQASFALPRFDDGRPKLGKILLRRIAKKNFCSVYTRKIAVGVL
jgi:hypothetical protein